MLTEAAVHEVEEVDEEVDGNVEGDIDKHVDKYIGGHWEILGEIGGEFVIVLTLSNDSGSTEGYGSVMAVSLCSNEACAWTWGY